MVDAAASLAWMRELLLGELSASPDIGSCSFPLSVLTLGRIPKTTHDITLDSQRNCRMRAKGEEGLDNRLMTWYLINITSMESFLEANGTESHGKEQGLTAREQGL